MADEEQYDHFSNLLPSGFRFSKEMEDLVGEQEEKSFVAVVHIDGNQMGKKLTAFNRHYTPKDGQSIRDFNEKYRHLFVSFSRSVDGCYKRAFKRMTYRLSEETSTRNTDFWLKLTDSGRLFPLRPLILAGDDVSYVVNGKLGLDSARIFLEELQLESIDVGSSRMTMHACAGVALVKKGYPFSRAHHLAEQLCKNAKTKILQDNLRHGFSEERTFDLSALDFHVVNGETDESLRAIRQSQYLTNDANLCMKPYYVLPNQEGETLMESAKDEMGQLLPHEDRKVLKDALDAAVARLQAFPRISLFKQTFKRITQTTVGRHKIKMWREVYHRSLVEHKYFIGQQQMNKILQAMDGVAEGEVFVQVAGTSYAVYYDAIEMMDLMIIDKIEVITP